MWEENLIAGFANLIAGVCRCVAEVWEQNLSSLCGYVIESNLSLCKYCIL